MEHQFRLAIITEFFIAADSMRERMMPAKETNNGKKVKTIYKLRGF